MQIRYLISICHAQNLACASSTLAHPRTKYHQGRAYGSREMLRTKREKKQKQKQKQKQTKQNKKKKKLDL